MGKIINNDYKSNGTARQLPIQHCCVNGEEIENVATFKYLGSQVHHYEHMTGDTEITSRIDLAKFYEHGKKLMNVHIKLHTRMELRLCS